MRVAEIKLYEFNDLKPSGQQKAIGECRDFSPPYNWYDSTVSDFIGKNTEINSIKVKSFTPFSEWDLDIIFNEDAKSSDEFYQRKERVCALLIPILKNKYDFYRSDEYVIKFIKAEQFEFNRYGQLFERGDWEE